jgi:hypothetical protein
MNETKITACRHTRTRLIAKDKDAEYVECLDCGTLLEAGELVKPASPQAKATENSDEARVDESLSDA